MSNEAIGRKPWNRPELKRIGEIKDVAGNPPVFNQVASSKS